MSPPDTSAPVLHATVRMRSRVPLAVIAALLFVQLVSPHRVWIILLCALCGLVVAGRLWVRALAHNVRVSRERVQELMQAGETVEQAYRLLNQGWLPVLWARAVDVSDMPGYPKEQMLAVSTATSYRWMARLVCRRRGLYTLGPMALHMQDPFGLFAVVQQYDESNKVLVTPAVVNLPAMLLPRGLASGRVVVRRPASELTQNISATRPYVSGDPWRHIHWRSSAHSGHLMSMTFTAEVSGDLWIVLDMDRDAHAGEGEESTVEYGVTLASSVAERLLQENRAVGLIASGSAPAQITPGRGEGHLWRLLEALALVSPGNTVRLPGLLDDVRPALGRQTTLMVITPSADPTWVVQLGPLLRRGAVPTVLLLDAASFGGQADLSAVRIALTQLTVPHQIVSKGYPFHRAKRKEVVAGSWEARSELDKRASMLLQGSEVQP